MICLTALVLCCHGNAASMKGLNIFDLAASRNEQLLDQMRWHFGGKPQRGWSLYVPLISRLIESDAEPDSPEFARSVHQWQQGEGLRPDGIVDQETWMKMVATFQSQRLKFRQAASPDDLFQAPASDFYDPSRPDDLRLVDRVAYDAYKRLLRAARSELGRGQNTETWLKIISAWRSPAYQAALRKRSPKSGRAGLAMRSPHFTGRALDLYVGGEPVSTADPNRRHQVAQPVYQWLVRNASRFGFYPYFYEPWHWEYRG
ncbi:MAG: D-alanyl-D-alanine carboxypeptidase family protein [Acidobacteriota bacterium]|nr:MAG: D-alanyl-D-alanine carboxypeptidase family protein [Acidobacteriota bacterium]